jgi:hypothetical protein
MVQKPLSEVADVVRGIAFPKEDKSYVQRPGDVACLRTTSAMTRMFVLETFLFRPPTVMNLWARLHRLPDFRRLQHWAPSFR